MLLGLDWFRKTRAGVLPFTGKLEFAPKGDLTKENHEGEELLATELSNFDSNEDEEDIDWEINMKLIPPTGPLSAADSCNFKKIIANNRDCFAFNVNVLSVCKIRQHEIHLLLLHIYTFIIILITLFGT